MGGGSSGPSWRQRIRAAVLDPFHGYLTALRGQLSGRVWTKRSFHFELWSIRRQMAEQARLKSASWMSARRSYRVRSRLKACSQAKVRSTTQRNRPRPEPCGWPRRAMTGVIPRARTRRRYVSWS